MSDINITKNNATMHITLDREKVLNALNLNMVREIAKQIGNWNDDPNVSGVIIKGAGEKAFCAGGDIVSVYHAKNIENNTLSYDFFREEYLLNIAIKNFTKPWISILNGYTMGGGLGLSVHGSHRLVTEKTITAMPETAIGLFPDVGGGYFLSRMPGGLGKYIAITGNILDFKSTLFCSIGTNFISTDDIKYIENEISSLRNYSIEDIDKLLLKYESKVGYSNSDLEKNLAFIDKHFVHRSIKEIYKSLEEDNSDWCIATLKTLSKKSPTSMAVAAEQITKAKDLSFEDCMSMEFRICQTMMSLHDFYEGVRANLVEKDRNPRWNPSHLSEINNELVEKHFFNLGKKELL